MRSRRNPSQPHSLSPYDPSPIGATSTTTFPRASSPSGFSQLLSKPAKWFTRNQSGQRAPSFTSPSEPRSSTSSFVRKPKISHPTDLRPILPSLQSEPYIQSPTQSASRSVSFMCLQKCSHDNATVSLFPGPYLTFPLHARRQDWMVYPTSLHPQTRRFRLTLVTCEAFHISHGPARPRNSASLVPRRLRLPWRTTSKIGYNSIALAALVIHIHQQRRIRNLNTHSPPSPLRVPPPTFLLHHHRPYHWVLLQQHHRRVPVSPCFMSAHIPLLQNFHQSCLLPR